MGYKYTWKTGIQLWTNQQLDVDKPVFVGTILVDLLTGDRYLIEHIFDAKPQDKFCPEMPDRAIRTRTLEPLSTEDLDKLRAHAGYVPDENCQPLGNLVFRTQEKVAA